MRLEARVRPRGFNPNLGSSADGFVTDVWCFKFSRSLISLTLHYMSTIERVGLGCWDWAGLKAGRLMRLEARVRPRGFNPNLGSSADGFVTDVLCFKFSRSLICLSFGVH